MKYPKINKQPRRMVSVPSLQGGMNLRDALNMCQDNQLTDSLNMWFKDGVLKTRPGKQKIIEYHHAAGATSDTVLEWESCDSKQQVHQNITKIVDGKTYTLVSYLCAYKNYKATYIDADFVEQTNEYENYSLLNFFWVGEEDILNQIYENGVSFESKILNYFVTVSPKEMYLFLKTEGGNTIYKYNEESYQWKPLSDEEIYAPLVKSGGTAIDDSNGNGNLGTQIEGYNLISYYYRMKIYAKDKNQTKNKMKYQLLFNTHKEDGTSEFDGMTITATLNGIEHSATYNWLGNAFESDNYEEGYETNDGYYLVATGGIFGFYKGKDATDYATIPDDWVWAEDLEVKAPCMCPRENFDKVFSMKKAEWFGGASEGINGGTRLFLGGNTQEAEQSLIVWSDLNNPLYFPENCYSYVGNSMSAVTAFGKQEDMLVIFKGNELYYTKYNQNSNISAENLINQSIVDYAASSAYFPLVQINPVIGCDCPDTVQLCRNRLVWTNNDGKVYTLTGASQYSERNVFCVSEMIERKLKTESDLKSAYALAFDGYYMLITNGRAYLMDYNSYGYQYVYSYQKAEDANIKIPWYCWDIGYEDPCQLYYTIKNKLLFFYYSLGYTQIELGLGIFDSDTDEGYPINCFAQTKFFDFGSPNYRKNIDAVGVSFGNNGGEPITVKYITESGEDCTTVTLCDDETDVRNAGFITSRILYPSIRSAVRFGVKFICEGNMAIEGLNITYRTLGGAR